MSPEMTHRCVSFGSSFLKILIKCSLSCNSVRSTDKHRQTNFSRVSSFDLRQSIFKCLFQCFLKIKNNVCNTFVLFVFQNVWIAEDLSKQRTVVRSVRITTEVCWLRDWRILDTLQQLSLPACAAGKTQVGKRSSPAPFLVSLPVRPKVSSLQGSSSAPTAHTAQDSLSIRQGSHWLITKCPPLVCPEDGKLYLRFGFHIPQQQLGNGRTSQMTAF